MRLGLFFIFAAIPFLELALLVKLGQSIGFWWTLALILSTAIAGAVVIRRQSLSVMQRAMDAVGRGTTPVASVVEGVFVLIAGFLLITPGLITDALGLLLLIPPVRRWTAVKVLKQIMRTPAFRVFIFGEKPHAGRSRGAGDRSGPSSPPPQRDPAFDGMNAPGTVIEGEFERIDERTIDPIRQPRNKRPG